MDQQSTDPANEVRRLQRCMNDLVSVLALPAVWRVSEPARILATFLDALMRIVDLDFLYARLRLDAHEAPIDALRTTSLYGTSDGRAELRNVLNRWSAENLQQWPAKLSVYVGAREISILPIRMGIEGELGFIVAGSQKAGFPEQTESLVLGVAANQLTIGLQQALRLNEQKQKQAEEALRASEANLRRVIDTIPTLSWCNLPDGPNEFLSKSWHDYTGLSPEEAHGWGWQVTFHPEDLPPLMERWKQMLTTGKPGEIEARIRRHDGVYRWFLIRAQPFRDEAGNILRWYGTSTDIHDRKRGENALRESEQRFRLILDGIAGLVAIMSPAGEPEIVNHQALTYFGKTVEELKGWSTSNAVHPDDLPGVISAWTRSVETASAYDVDHRLLRADGQYRWFHARGLPQCDAQGRVLHWYVLLTDIHDRKQAEEALTMARAELAHVARITSLGALTASIAHEVNQPLSGIVMNASTCLRMLSGDPPNIDGARETARRTIRDGNRASEVVTRLRALFKRKEVAAEPIDLNEAAREVIALSLSELQSNRVMVRHDLAENLPAVKGDRIQIQQVILNLLRNASDAMREVDDRPRYLLIKTECDDGKNVQLAVEDSGIGFAADAADRLFESFYTTKKDGMGIGLSVSRSIIEAHRGRLWASANDGAGSSFKFSIPVD